MALLLRRDRPRIARADEQLSYEEAAAESERVVAWVAGRMRRARPRKIAFVAVDCLNVLDATLAQLYAARRPPNFPERSHGELVDALRKLVDKLATSVELDDGAGTKVDVSSETAAFARAFESLHATGVFTPSGDKNPA